MLKSRLIVRSSKKKKKKKATLVVTRAGGKWSNIYFTFFQFKGRQDLRSTKSNCFIH